MKYYSYEQQDKMRKEIDAVLQKYFSEDDWGADVIIENDGRVYNIAILKVKTEPVVRYGARTTSYTWTHHANICPTDDGKWEVNTQFNGEKENEMWVYKKYARFADACKCVATSAFKNMKVIAKY